MPKISRSYGLTLPASAAQAPSHNLTGNWTACGTCGRETAHKILTQVHQSDESPDGEIQVWHDYQTIICQGCKTVSFCKASKCTEDFDVDETGRPELSV